MKRLLLIDSDIVCFKAASIVEEPTDWGGGLWTLHSDLGQAQGILRTMINDYIEKLEADEVIMCLTDRENWRNDVLPSYKENRKDVRKPLVLSALKEWVADEYETFIRPTLEADDVMGILSTWGKFKPEYQKIIVSEDKDMKTIPGWLWNPAKDKEPWLVSEDTANYWHMMQTLTGDPTDNYKGCEGIGEVVADRILKDEPHITVPREHTITRGKRKGETEMRWELDYGEYGVWDTVVSYYKKAGFGESEALTQARVARICRASDYNFKKKEVKLWEPQSKS